MSLQQKSPSISHESLLDADKMPRIEAKLAFIATAAWALGLLQDSCIDALPNVGQKQWEGLAWFTEEIIDDLHEWFNERQA